MSGTESGRSSRRFLSLGLLLGAAILWGALMALSAALALYHHRGLQTDNFRELIALYFLGGFCGWPMALIAAFYTSRTRHVETRFAASVLFLAIFTILATAGLFALDYRMFYARWHAPFGTLTWFFQFAFTCASAAYQFGVLGSRLFFPLGVLWLPLASLYIARRMR